MAATAGLAVLSFQRDDVFFPVNILPGKAGQFSGADTGPEHKSEGRHTRAVLRLGRGAQKTDKVVPRYGVDPSFLQGGCLYSLNGIDAAPTVTHSAGEDRMQNPACFGELARCAETFGEGCSAGLCI